MNGQGMVLSCPSRFELPLLLLLVFHSCLHPLPQLETDESLIIPKARAALERYGHQVVIGNDLHNRKYRVVFVSKRSSPVSGPDTHLAEVEYVESWLCIDTPSSPKIGHTKEIEEDIIAELVQRHDTWINPSG
jgi:phosphopantothenate-cysteine ligase